MAMRGASSRIPTVDNVLRKRCCRGGSAVGAGWVSGAGAAGGCDTGAGCGALDVTGVGFSLFTLEYYNSSAEENEATLLFSEHYVIE